MRLFLTVIKLCGLALVVTLSGCATHGNSYDESDPFQSYNRAMYSFNNGLDTVAIKPLAEGYSTFVPPGIKQGVSNFFNNLDDINVIVNDLLQCKFEQAWQDTGRFALNSTVGIAGIFDVASLAGHRKNNEDFGQTLGVWGVEPGPYFVLPIFGPRNIRDTFGFVADMFVDPTNTVDSFPRTELTVLRIVDRRAQLLNTSNLINQAALDEYIYVREAYKQHRLNLVYDGNPPEDDFDLFAP